MARDSDDGKVLREVDQPYIESPRPSARRATSAQIKCLGFGLIVLALLFSYFFVVLWPETGSLKSENKQEICFWVAHCLPLAIEHRILLLVTVAGGLGSFVHTSTSFGDFVGNEKLTNNWMWWYILKPFIGMVLATILYLTLRAGLLTANSDANSVNVYGVAALASMAGMFSKQATDKLSEMFNTMFKTTPGGGDEKRKENLDNPIPTLVSMTPTTVAMKSHDIVVALKGSDFIKGSVIKVNGINRPTKYIDATSLSFQLLAEDLANEGELVFAVFNPGPGGGLSAALRLKVTGAPVLTSAAVKDHDDGQDELDSCDGQCVSHTPDKDLPPSTGGVAS